jgi:hypothetical protein
MAIPKDAKMGFYIVIGALVALYLGNLVLSKVG